MNKNNQSPLIKKPFYERDGVKSVFASLVSIVIGMFVGCIIVVAVGLFSDEISGKGILEGIKIIFLGMFNTGRESGELTFGFNPVNIGDMFFRATPVILTGLSVAVAFKTGLFNIGASGQYLMGTAATIYIALMIPSESVHPVLIWILAFFGGIIAGAVWGIIPGMLKAFLNINEVIACIMTNWIAANLVTWFFDVNEPLKNFVEYGKVGYACKTTSNGVATSKMFLDKIFPGSQVNGGIIIAIIIAVLVYIIMNKTTLGYELKICGSNRHAARYAGINDKRDIILSMAIAGGLAGCAASLYWLAGNTEFYWSTYQALPMVGFNGIPVALLASNNPIGVIFAGCFMSMLDIAGLQLKNLTAYNEFVTDIIIAVIVYMSAFSLLIKELLGRHKKKAAAKAEKTENENKKEGKG